MAELHQAIMSSLVVGPQDGPPPVIVDEKLYTPESSIYFALADLKTLPPEQYTHIRYLSLYNIPANKRDDFAKIVSFVCNSLSTRRKIYIPVFVGASDKTVIRINIKDYDWKPEVWDKLAREGSGVRAFAEPYFHTLIVASADTKFKTTVQNAPVFAQSTRQRIDTIVDGGIAQKANLKKGDIIIRIGNTQIQTFEDLQTAFSVNSEVEVEVLSNNEKKVIKLTPINGRVGVSTNSAEVPVIVGEKPVEVKFPVEQKNIKERLVSPPWISADIMTDFISLTQSEAPVLRADWFICNATLPPAYYNFLNLGKKLADFEAFAFADLKKAELARGQDRAIIIQSGVTRNNRRARRSPTFTGGYYWETFDTLNSIRGNKSLTNLLDEKFDAGEFICSLPNGLQAYFLSNGKFERQDEAPINIAADSTAIDRVVRTGRSCMICHAEGIKGIEDEVRSLNKWNPNHESVRLLITQEKDAYKIDDLFSSDLERQIIKDMQIYADAIALTNGLKTQANAKLYAQIYDNYTEHLMSKEEVARELALSINELDKLLKLSNDPVMLGLLRQPIRPLRRDQFEESFQGFMLIVVASKLRPGEVPRIVLPEKATPAK